MENVHVPLFTRPVTHLGEKGLVSLGFATTNWPRKS